MQFYRPEGVDEVPLYRVERISMKSENRAEVVVDLPDLESAADFGLRSEGSELRVSSKKTANKISVSLPFVIDPFKTKARFNKASRQLVAVLVAK